MIELAALKEQLKLLGHDLPDDQVVAILRDMNIDFADNTDNTSDDLIDKQPPGPPKTGSILDNFQDRQQKVAGPPPDASRNQPHSSLLGYTCPAQNRVVGLKHSTTTILRSPKLPGDIDRVSDGDYSDDGDDALNSDEPGISCRYCVSPGDHAAHTSAYDYTTGGAGACAHRRTAQGTSTPSVATGFGSGHCRYANGANLGMSHDQEDREALLGRMSLAGPAERHVSSKAAAAVGGTGTPSSAMQRPQPSAVGRSKDQLPRSGATRPPSAGGRTHAAGAPDDRQSDVILSDPDKNPLGLGASVQELLYAPRQQAWASHEVNRPGSAAAGIPARGLAAMGPYAGWLSDHPRAMDALAEDEEHARRPLSPPASDRSFMSRASTRCSTGSRGGTKKVDRVQRYQQLQQEWSQSRFLKQGGGTTRGTHRKPVNFHNHFASLHAAEEAERQRMLRETRAKTKKELGAATEAPTANRRDELRWQTRMRLKNQI